MQSDVPPACQFASVRLSSRVFALFLLPVLHCVSYRCSLSCLGRAMQITSICFKGLPHGVDHRLVSALRKLPHLCTLTDVVGSHRRSVRVMPPIGLLTKLQSLHLEESFEAAHMAKQLPSLTGLTSLCLELHVKSLFTMSLQWAELTMLQRLCHLSVTCAILSPLQAQFAGMAQFPQLQSLHMGSVMLICTEDSCSSREVACLSKLQRLSELQLRFNRLKKFVKSGTMIAAVAKSTGLQHLQLSIDWQPLLDEPAPSRSAEDAAAFHPLASMLQLTRLDLRGFGPMTAAQLDVLGAACSTMPQLADLCLACNGIMNDGAKAIATHLSSLTSLTCLQLHDNELGSDAVEALRGPLATLRRLKRVTLLPKRACSKTRQVFAERLGPELAAKVSGMVDAADESG